MEKLTAKESDLNDILADSAAEIAAEKAKSAAIMEEHKANFQKILNSSIATLENIKDLEKTMYTTTISKKKQEEMSAKFLIMVTSLEKSIKKIEEIHCQFPFISSEEEINQFKSNFKEGVNIFLKWHYIYSSQKRITIINNYKALGLKENATQTEITKAFRTLALKLHPDKGGSKEKFIEILDAYQALLK